jgi:hypothetical protein
MRNSTAIRTRFMSEGSKQIGDKAREAVAILMRIIEEEASQLAPDQLDQFIDTLGKELRERGSRRLNAMRRSTAREFGGLRADRLPPV